MSSISSSTTRFANVRSEFAARYAMLTLTMC